MYAEVPVIHGFPVNKQGTKKIRTCLQMIWQYEAVDNQLGAKGLEMTSQFGYEIHVLDDGTEDIETWVQPNSDKYLAPVAK